MKALLAPLDDIPETGTRRIDFFGRDVHLFRDAGRARAVLDYCLHLGGPLERRGERFVCGWHGAQFDARTGCRCEGPAPTEARLMFVPTREEDGALYYVYGE
jgi:nitrite reductase/ring-hydroxylating ferredoxin subunit